jgi:MFS transporter, putative metabolite:H+ symporter
MLVVGGHSLGAYYALCCALGWSSGYWAVFITMSAQFGPRIGMRNAAILLGACSLLVAAAALRQLEETYGKDLDFVE